MIAGAEVVSGGVCDVSTGGGVVKLSTSDSSSDDSSPPGPVEVVVVFE